MKKKLGRPKLPKGNAKTAMLRLRLTQAEMHKIEQRAKASGVDIPEWVRFSLLSQ